MVKILLKSFISDDFELILCSHTTRTPTRLYPLLFPIRFIKDIGKLFIYGLHADGVHIYLQYRSAIVREYFIIRLARLIKLPVFVEIRAGYFISWYFNTNIIYKKMADDIINNSKIIGSQGQEYITFLKEKFDKDVVYVPNFVISKLIPRYIEKKRCYHTHLKILFVGYCSKAKGIIELIKGCQRVAESGRVIELTLIGKEDTEITRWINSYNPHRNFKITRKGYQSHDKVLEAFALHDIFVLPTRYSGEGHPNVLNEAMMMKMIIVTTKHGFICDLLDDHSCYFINKNDHESIAKSIIHISENYGEAVKKSENAYKRLIENFTDKQIIPRIENVYRQLVS